MARPRKCLERPKLEKLSFKRYKRHSGVNICSNYMFTWEWGINFLFIFFSFYHSSFRLQMSSKPFKISFYIKNLNQFKLTETINVLKYFSIYFWTFQIISHHRAYVFYRIFISFLNFCLLNLNNFSFLFYFHILLTRSTTAQSCTHRFEIWNSIEKLFILF